MVQLAGSAKYLISPVLAGFLLGIADIRLLLLLDMGTFFVTVVTTLAVRRGIESRVSGGRISFLPEIKEGWKALTGRTGMPALVFMGALITFCLGMIQTLASPMVLSFADSTSLGTLMTVIAFGMLVSSMILGGFSIEDVYKRQAESKGVRRETESEGSWIWGTY